MSAILRIRKHSGLTWLVVALAVALCVFYLEGIFQFLLAPTVSAKDARGFESNYLIEFVIVMMIPDGGRIAVGLLQSSLAIVGCGAAIFAAFIMWRAPDKAANRQIVGLLIAYALFGALNYFFNRLPEYRNLYMGARPFFEMLSGILLVFFALGFARFLVIFPRPVDVESVHRSHLARPFFLRWTGNATVEKSVVLRPWHRHLVSGRLLWLAPVLPMIFLVAGISLGDSGGGIVFVGLTIVVVFYFFFGLPYSFASISHLYHFGTDEERRRVAWLRAVMLGTGVALLCSILLPMVAGKFLTDDVRGKIGASVLLFWMLLPPLAIMAVGAAVLGGGALDPRVAFTRITLWTVLGLVVTLAFIALERFAAIKVVEWFQLPADTGAVAAGAIIAGTFMPVRSVASRQIRRLAERWIPLEAVADGERVRSVVAIVDLSGYTALSANDEPAAMLQSAALTRMGQKVTNSHGGTLVKSLGDAVLLTFDDVDESLRAVQELHDAFPKAIETLGLEPLRLHSALHIGEIVRRHDGDIFGQTVNITARLVDAASGGEIVASEKIRDVAFTKFAFEDLGLRRFKNVTDAVYCYKVLGDNA